VYAGRLRRPDDSGNILQTWKHFAAPAVVFAWGIGQMIWHGYGVFLGILQGLVWALCFYLVAWAGTFITNYIWLSPATLHKELQTETDQLHARTQGYEKHERPYIEVSAGQLAHKSFGVDIQIVFTITNAGTVPARAVIADVDLRFSERTPRSISTGGEGIVLFPGRSHVLSFQLLPDEVPYISSSGWEFSASARYKGAEDYPFTTSATFQYHGVPTGFVLSAGRCD
jgi:hypothetical protein